MMDDAKTTERLVRWAGVAGLSAAVLVGAGEFLLHVGPGPGDGGGYGFFSAIEPWRLSAGHFVSILAAPLYVLGYWHLSRRLDRGAPVLSRVFFLIGGYAFVVGAVWLGQRAFLGFTVHAGASLDLLATLAGHNQPLVMVLRAAMITASLIWIWVIATGRSHYPRWLALFSPAALLAAIFAAYTYVPVIGAWLAPVAMNAAHAVVFSLSLAFGRRRN